MSLRTNLSLGIADGFIVGDSFSLDITLLAVPTGLTVTEAWWTVKAAVTDPDPGDMQLVITSESGAAGQITDDGMTSGHAALLFTATPTDTSALVAGEAYQFDIQIQYSDSTIRTVGMGTLIAGQGITEDQGT